MRGVDADEGHGCGLSLAMVCWNGILLDVGNSNNIQVCHYDSWCCLLRLFAAPFLVTCPNALSVMPINT